LERQIDDAQGLQAISIRLDKELIEKFGQIAKIHSMGYQLLMRGSADASAEAEIKVILAAVANASEKKTVQKMKASKRLKFSWMSCNNVVVDCFRS
jgi:hypothetical protein